MFLLFDFSFTGIISEKVLKIFLCLIYKNYFLFPGLDLLLVLEHAFFFIILDQGGIGKILVLVLFLVHLQNSGGHIRKSLGGVVFNVGVDGKGLRHLEIV